MIQAVSINSYQVYPFEKRQSFLSFLENGHWNNILVALNAEKLIRDDEELRQLVNTNIGYPDGVGAVWAMRKAGKDAIKIPGSEFWLDIIEAFHKEKSFYLVGAKPEIIEQTVKKLHTQFPALQIKGYHDGYFNDEEYHTLKKEILRTKPDAVFVAIGSPKQEYIMQELQEQHKALYMGLGGSFDVYTGHVQRAPEAWINLNLEWAYRLIKQPNRIIRQRVLVKFLFRLLTGRL
jgi:UDP-N-acetyl-D-mannosaminouronate:lipid I N-acetyl-D-mannosaminouronosyltransferase